MFVAKNLLLMYGVASMMLGFIGGLLIQQVISNCKDICTHHAPDCCGKKTL